MKTATFFLSTGRCGTQWITAHLLADGKESAVIEHEPLHNRYYPRLMLGSNDPEKTGNAAEIFSHCEMIEKILEEKNYIECGWPLWGAIPYLLKRFEGRVRIVHLVRHPIPTACSWVSHGAFCPPLAPGLPFREKILASPFDEGTAFPHYCKGWEGMNPFEKALFFWAEVNALGLKLEETAKVLWLRIRCEDLFHGNALKCLRIFLELSPQKNSEGRVSEIKDDFHSLCGFWWNPRDIQKYPEFMKTAVRLGYDPLDFDEEKLRRRYVPYL